MLNLRGLRAATSTTTFRTSAAIFDSTFTSEEVLTAGLGGLQGLVHHRLKAASVVSVVLLAEQ